MAPERRRKLLETAAREFAAGYEQASLNRIIRACGMSKSSFYHYVPSKLDLFDLVVDDMAAALVRELRVPAPHDFAVGDFWEQVGGLLDRLVRLAEREPAFVDLGRMFYVPGAPAGQRNALGRCMAAVNSWVEQTLAAGRASGAVRDDLPAALQGRVTLAILRSFDEWTLDHQAEFDPEEVRRLARAQFGAVRRILAPDAHGPGPRQAGEPCRVCRPPEAPMVQRQAR